MTDSLVLKEWGPDSLDVLPEDIMQELVYQSSLVLKKWGPDSLDVLPEDIIQELLTGVTF